MKKTEKKAEKRAETKKEQKPDGAPAPNKELVDNLAVATGCDERTVRRWLQGKEVLSSTKFHLQAALDKLKEKGKAQQQPQKGK